MGVSVWGLAQWEPLFRFLPSVPFLLLAAFCFARSSERLNMWFTGTKLYQDNLVDYTAGRGMTKKVKIRIMCTVTLLMSIGFILMGLRSIMGCIILTEQE